MDLDIKAATNAVARTASPSPDHHHNGRSSSVSLDDPDVRLAAEALGDLRAGMSYSHMIVLPGQLSVTCTEHQLTLCQYRLCLLPS
jgi:hypothetical protein